MVSAFAYVMCAPLSKNIIIVGKLVPDDLVISLVQEEIELPQCQVKSFRLV